MPSTRNSVFSNPRSRRLFVVGFVVGTALGIIFDNIPIGVGAGIAAGLLIGSLARRKTTSDKSSE